MKKKFLHWRKKLINPLLPFLTTIVYISEQYRRFSPKVSVSINQSWATFCDRSPIRYAAFCFTTGWTTWFNIPNRSSNPIPKHRRNSTYRWRYPRAINTRWTRATITIRLTRLSNQIDRFLCGVQKILQRAKTRRLRSSEFSISLFCS